MKTKLHYLFIMLASFAGIYPACARNTLIPLYSFGPTDPAGAAPQAGLVQASDGNLYGTTYGGGAHGQGTVFRITTNGAETVLYSFTGSNDGASPIAGLVQASDGNLYGTTYRGGTNSYGTVFRVSTNGVFTSIYSFAGGNDGATPVAGLVQANDGNLYGTTSAGGDTNAIYYGYGTVFRITTNGAERVIYSFTDGNDGATPAAGLVQASDGNLYGTTPGVYRNGNLISYGTVFRITTNGALTTLYSFTDNSDGGSPDAGLVQASDGNLYGTASSAGNTGNGTVFRMTTNGVFTSIYSFTGGDDSSNPRAGLVQASDGNLYGTSYDGGTNDYGSIFRITTNGVETVLYSFTAGNDGGNPLAGLVQASDGNLYGTAYYDGVGGSGTIFRMTTNGVFTLFYSFIGGNDGANPDAGLIQASDGNLYGTAASGGTRGKGTVFRMTTNGVFGPVYSFTGGNDGTGSQAGLVQANDGNLYGTTPGGGSNGGYGTVFRITTNGAESVLYSFTGGSDGGFPYAGLVQASDGNLYGTASAAAGNGGNGTVFRITTNGVFHWLYSFAGGNDGAGPQAGLVQASDGNLYGTTSGGGSNFGNGVVFRITTNGAETVIYSFTGGNDGSEPYSALVQASDGNLYGTTPYGGTNFEGNVFRITTNGVLTPLYSFTGGNDGSEPYAALVQASDGNLYGTAYEGGASSNGVIFRITTGGVLTTLYSFTGGNDGAGPYAGLMQASDGNLYGTAAVGGTYGNGTVFSFSPGVVSCPTISVGLLDVTNVGIGVGYNQTITATGGVTPYSYEVTSGTLPGGLGLSEGGVLSGTPTNTGSFNFSVTAVDANGCTGTNSYSLNVIICPSITLGTLGATNAAFGSNYAQTITASGGVSPYSYGLTGGSLPCNLSLSSGGILSGRPLQTGDFTFSVTATDADGCTGTNTYSIFINPGSFSYASFNGSNGAYLGNALALSGNTLYGTTVQGGSSDSGTVFAIKTDGTGLTNLYSFTPLNGTNSTNSDGALPYGGLIVSGSTLYGTASGGGSAGNGTVFALSTNGSGFTNLHNFTPLDTNTSANSDGANPYGVLILSGNTLYGTAYYGGTASNGTVFALNTDGTGFRNLHNFTATPQPDYTNSDGANPPAGLLLSGNILYGEANNGGSGGTGTVFAINTNGTGFTNLYSFTALNGATATNNDGAYPYTGLILSGNTLYSTASSGGTGASGTVFALNTNGTGFTNLYNFTPLENGTNSDGASLSAPLVLIGNTLYGSASTGGGAGVGTLFSLNTNGSGFTTLYTFGNCDGDSPQNLLLSGNTFYGTAYSGGAANDGTVFSLALGSLAVNPPQLGITLSRTNVVLMWPTNAAGFTLQTSASLSPVSWSNISSGISTSGSNYIFTNAVRGSSSFFRLMQ